MSNLKLAQQESRLKKYLVCDCDESAVDFAPSIVHAASPAEALDQYVRKVYAKDEIFREDVLERKYNMCFLERFFISTPEENELFDKTGTVNTAMELVFSRVREFFAAKPEFGNLFVRYMETADESLIDDDIFEFIAVTTMTEKPAFAAFDIDSFAVIE